MPKMLPAIFSYEGMKEKWDEDNPDEPYNRQSDLIAGRYALDKWIVRVDDDGKTIATTGWKEHPTHTAVGGTKSTKDAGAGNYRALADAREQQINQSKPLLAAFGHASGDNDRWFATMKQNGWAFVNDPNWEQYKTLIPEEILTDWLSRFPSNMGIRPVKGAEDMAKCSYPDDNINEWFSVVKNERYSRAVGSNGYDIIDSNTGKRVNKTGLSKSQAGAMLEAIKRGETDLTSYEAHIKRKAKHSKWQNILRKYNPDGSFEHYDIGEPVADLGTRDRFKDKGIQSLGNVEHKAFVTEQYLRQVSDRLPDATTSLMNDWLIKLNALSLSRGKYWFFGTNVYEDKTYVTIDVINKGDRYLDTAKKFNLENMDSAIIFIGVSKSMVGKIKRGQTIPKGRKFIDLWGKGGVRGLQKKDSRPFQRRGSINKWHEVLKYDVDTEKDTEVPQYKTKEDGGFESYAITDIPVMAGGHYRFRGHQRIGDDSQELRGWAETIKERISETQPKGNWFYRKPLPDDKPPTKQDNQVIMFDVVPPKEVLPQQSGTTEDRKVKNPTTDKLMVFTTVMVDNNKDGDNEKWFDMWEEEETRVESRTTRSHHERELRMNSAKDSLTRDLKASNITKDRTKALIKRLIKQLNHVAPSRAKEINKDLRDAKERLTNVTASMVKDNKALKELKEKQQKLAEEKED